MSVSFEENYPALTRWIKQEGWLELGRDHYSRSLVRVVDEGGLVWEGETNYKTLDEALTITEKALKEWMAENFSDYTKE